MAASKLAPLVRVAVGTTAACVDLMLLRAALAASRGKRRRLRELNGRLRYYEEMAERYAQIDPSHFYAQPEAIRPLRERSVRRLPRGAVVDLAWWSGYEPRLHAARDGFLRWRSNHTAHIRLFRHQQPARTALIWIHGYRSGSFAIEERVCPAFDLYKRGFDVALYTVPFHGLRAPRPFLRAPLFPSQGNIARTNEGFGQVVWELRGLVAWLRKRGAEAVGVMGMSLGGYCTSLLATVEPTLDFALPFIPLADFTDAVVAHEALRGIAINPVLQEASRRALAIHRPLGRTAAIPGERVLVIGGEADRITGRMHAERLAAHFRSDVIWFLGGHILQYGREQAFREAIEFAERRGGPLRR